jgi:thiamine-phosphate diphosphorylase
MRPPLPRLHAITDERVARRPDLDAIAQALAGGGGATLAFHARGRSLSGLEHYRLATRLSGYPPTRLFVNDRLDVALAVPSTGVQLGVRSLSPRDARRLAGSREWWIGSSVHDVAEARAARAAGADYLVAGPVYHTASHPEVGVGGGDIRPPLGPERLREIIAIGLPVIAIGGITSERVREVCGAGAYGVAAIRALWDASDPAGAARTMAGACSA